MHGCGGRFGFSTVDLYAEYMVIYNTEMVKGRWRGQQAAGAALDRSGAGATA